MVVAQMLICFIYIYYVSVCVPIGRIAEIFILIKSKRPCAGGFPSINTFPIGKHNFANIPFSILLKATCRKDLRYEISAILRKRGVKRISSIQEKVAIIIASKTPILGEDPCVVDSIVAIVCDVLCRPAIKVLVYLLIHPCYGIVLGSFFRIASSEGLMTLPSIRHGKL